MRYIEVRKNQEGRYITSFYDKHNHLEWWVESYVIMSHEIMVDWIENAKHPDYRYT